VVACRACLPSTANSSLLFFALFALPFSHQAQTLTSPNGQLDLTVEAAPDGATPPASPLLYQVSFHGKTLIEWSALRLEFEGQRSLSESFSFRFHVPPHHRKSQRSPRALQRTADGTGSSGGLTRKFFIEARAYDDAIAFRFVVPQQRNIAIND
jgi:alpha-glucosidase